MLDEVTAALAAIEAQGAFATEHRGEKKVFGGAARGVLDLSLLAFYADCHHEVKPVDSGYRITLTYHLLFRGEPGARAPVPLSAVERPREGRATRAAADPAGGGRHPRSCSRHPTEA